MYITSMSGITMVGHQYACTIYCDMYLIIMWYGKYYCTVLLIKSIGMQNLTPQPDFGG